jgi:pimeloyl-ACP methyl ester carboxylesterase
MPLLLILSSILVSFTIFSGQTSRLGGTPTTTDRNVYPTIKDTLTISSWLVAGPFSVGAREGLVEPIQNPESIVPREGEEVRDILNQGGIIRWTEVLSKDGVAETNFQDVKWDTLQDIYGYPGLINRSYFYGEIDIEEQSRALVFAGRVGAFILNGTSFPGSVYGDKAFKIPVILKKGTNRILVKVAGFGDHRFTLKFLPAPAPVIAITKDATVPDIEEFGVLNSTFRIPHSQLEGGWVGIPIMNTTSKRLKNIILTVGDQKKTISSLMPLSVLKIPIYLDRLDTTLTVIVGTPDSGHPFKDRITLRKRNPGDSFKATFLSKIDHSCQYYAVLPPKEYDPSRLYSLIVTLHGAGVEATGQVDAYTQKDWAFIVAPTNRRRFGFDWQDWGRLDALEVLEEIKKIYPIDEYRIYLTGHSMGGHGTYHIGLAHPDLFAAIAPSAGWTTFQLYVPWFLQKSSLYASPRQIACRDHVLREDLVPLYLENAGNLPVYILQGGSDDNVPPVHGRLSARILEELGYKYIYNEVPGKGHWWNDKDTPGVDCVDLPALMEFFQTRARDPYPKQVHFRTVDLGQSNRNGWVEINQQEVLYQDSRIDAKRDSQSVDIRVENIHMFTLHLRSTVPGSFKTGTITFNINGETFSYRFEKEGYVIFRKKGTSWTLKSEKKIKDARVKTPRKYGPIKQAYSSPFILVYGTQNESSTGDPESSSGQELPLLHHARLQSLAWWLRANGFVEIIPDTEVTQHHMENYNLILFGGAERNWITKMIAPKLPIVIKEDKIIFGKKELYVSDIDGMNLQMIYPNPLNPKRFILLLAETNPKSESTSGGLSRIGTLYSGAGLPDFILFDETVRDKGWGGILACGFFNQDWKIDESLLYTR